MHYYIASSSTKYSLQNYVQDLIDEGYKPCGGISVCSENGMYNQAEANFYQSMIKE